MRRWARIITVGSALIASGVTPAIAQTRQPAASPQARRDELAKVQEMMADPDPLARLANMETILNSGDAVRIQVALRLALQSDDLDLRALGMRAYIASRKEIILDIQLPPVLQQRLDGAQLEPEKMQELYKQYPFIQQLNGSAFRVQLAFSKYDMSSSTGTVVNPIYYNGAYPSTFAVSGDRVMATVVMQIGATAPRCSVDFRPIRGTFTGSLSCPQAGAVIFPKLAVTAPVF